ncbi:MAG: redox-sensing transcriptional repressor Rex [Ruminococcaceae bacterium]|nr:redox-sensing transcriptional repressor Rex [Oscillospiraceae bacterium]
MAKDNNISMPVIRRLPRYYRFLYDLKENGVTRISSRELSQRMGLTASQIRQDFNCFGGFGQQGYGYIVEQLYHEIGRILGIEEQTDAILLGVGNMGKAVAKHMDFETRGFRLVGLFDDAPQLIGTVMNGKTIRPTGELEAFCREHHPKMAILCIPKEAAPALVERLLACHIKGFWNFSHYDITFDHPEAVVENVHLGDSLMTLSYRMEAPVMEEE